MCFLRLPCIRHRLCPINPHTTNLEINKVVNYNCILFCSGLVGRAHKGLEFIANGRLTLLLLLPTEL